MLLTFLSKFAGIILALLMLFSPAAPPTPYEVTDADTLSLSFAIIADTHIQGIDTDASSQFGEAIRLIRGINDMNSAVTPPDALIIAGDCTMNGQNMENSFLQAALATSKLDNLILAAGNHDLWEYEYNVSRNRFTSLYNRLTGRDIDKVNYATKIEGHYFIVLGTDENIPLPDGSGMSTAQAFHEAQLKWLEDTLAIAANETPGRPVFVINHNPLAGDMALNPVYNILNACENEIYFFYGHMHSQFFTTTKWGNVRFVNVPAFHQGADSKVSGWGYVVEVYENRIEFRPRNFLTSEWLGSGFGFNVA